MSPRSSSPVPESRATGDDGSRRLRERAREAIRAGRLPSRPPERTWGGRGTGAPCAICADPVGPEQVELEVELAERESGGVELHHVHVRCFAAWECEAREVAAVDRPSERGDALPRASHGATLPARDREAGGTGGAP